MTVEFVVTAHDNRCPVCSQSLLSVTPPTADLERAIREAQYRQNELTEEYTRLCVLVEKAQALSSAYDDFHYDPSAESIGTLFEAACDVAAASDVLTIDSTDEDYD